MTREEQLAEAVKLLITQVDALSASHVSLMRFFLSTSPHLSAAERSIVQDGIDGFELRQRHLLAALGTLQDQL